MVPRIVSDRVFAIQRATLKQGLPNRCKFAWFRSANRHQSDLPKSLAATGSGVRKQLTGPLDFDTATANEHATKLRVGFIVMFLSGRILL